MKLLNSLLKLLPSQLAYAHCDVPCGIYDPHTAQMAAHTVLRMTNLINDLKASSENAPFEERKKIIHDISRITRVKEEHAEIVKHEITIIWGDYFKPEHLEKFPELHQLVFETLKVASKTKQIVDMEAAETLLKNVQKFSEIFYQTKGLEVVRIPSGYPTQDEIVSYK